MRRRLGFAALAVLAGLTTAGCKSTPAAPEQPPVPGDFTISLATPNSDDGAIVIRVTASQGKEITTGVLVCTNCRLFMEQPSATELRAVLTGDLVAGPLVKVTVSDVNVPSAYTVLVQQVASRTFAVRSTSGYSLTIQ